MNIARVLKTAFYGAPVHYTFSKFYVTMDIRYLIVMFCYCKIRRSVAERTLDRSIKISCEEMIFSQSRFQFSFKDFFAI